MLTTPNQTGFPGLAAGEPIFGWQRVERINKMYKIMAKFKSGVEEIDTTETSKEAEYLLEEYKIAFGLSSSSMWIEKQ